MDPWLACVVILLNSGPSLIRLPIVIKNCDPAGLLAYYLQSGEWLYCGLVYLAAAGSVMVSYVKARAEALGFTAKVGLLSRVERYLVLAPALLFNIPWLAVWIIAIFANFTALQRILKVRQQAAEQKKMLFYTPRK